MIATGGSPPEKKAPGTVGTNAGTLKQIATIGYHDGLKNQPLPQWIRDMIASMPSRGEGLHNWVFRVARALHPYRTPQQIVAILEEVTTGEPIPSREIEQAVKNSKATAWKPGQPALKWPHVNEERRRAITESGTGWLDLWEQSPVNFGNSKSHAEEIIDTLFPENPLLCIGRSKSSFGTRKREEWRGTLSKAQLIVPSPMTARTGFTQEGKESAHSLDNTGPRRFLVIEQDGGSEDEQAAVLLYFAERAPLVLAVHSGGKSIHGWFMAAEQPQERLYRFMRDAVALGVDPATWSRCQFVRMPDGTRDNGNRQRVYFFNPMPLL